MLPGRSMAALTLVAALMPALVIAFAPSARATPRCRPALMMAAQAKATPAASDGDDVSDDRAVPTAAWRTRRQLWSGATTAAAAAALVARPGVAAAQGGGLDEITRTIELSRRPAPLALPRAKVEQDFAVLLMRKSYEVADELDFVGMDTFQKQVRGMGHERGKCHWTSPPPLVLTTTCPPARAPPSSSSSGRRSTRTT